MEMKKLPVGIESFEKIRRENFYYIDKTGLIKELLWNWSEVTLITRPRRFGKSLNMNMLKCFFEPGSDKGCFEGLAIRQEKELCEKYMGKFPVISVSLKGANGEDYETACRMLSEEIKREAGRFQFLQESERLTLHDKERYQELLKQENCAGEVPEILLMNSLQILSGLLYKHFEQKVIVLIDEYDVPLAKAFARGYYDRMVLLLRNMFEQVLKSNESLYFAVLSGCLRIAKESIFTGLNNLSVLTIADVEFDEYFGFKDKEVTELLGYYGLSAHYDILKEWYDGYHFGNVDVYCPWDVVCHCNKLRADETAAPGNYWSNTSSNDAVRRFIEEADNGTTKREIENLIAGESIEKEIHFDLTYPEMYKTIDHIWSLLFTTGYLTQRGKPKGDVFDLVIPNREIRKIFTRQIMELFRENVKKDGETLNRFCDCLQNGEAENVEKYLEAYLKKTISIRDTFVKKQLKENFYHGILIGLLGVKDSWGVASNKETGEGYSDILVEAGDGETGIVLEIKYADDGNLETACKQALHQIEKKNYEEKLREDGIETVLKYGVAFYKKRCKAMLAQ